MTDELEKISDEISSVQNQIDRLTLQKEALRERLESLVPDEGYAATFSKFSWVERRNFDEAPTLAKLKEAYKKSYDLEKKVLEAEGFKFPVTRTIKVEIY